MNETKLDSISVLLVDDETLLLRSLGRTLSELGFGIETADCADKALGIMKQTRIDVVVCDQKMPGPSGLELLSQLKHSYPHLIMMMLSGEICGDSEVEGCADALGVTELFCKPCDANLIAGRIRHAMRSRESSTTGS